MCADSRQDDRRCGFHTGQRNTAFSPGWLRPSLGSDLLALWAVRLLREGPLLGFCVLWAVRLLGQEGCSYHAQLPLLPALDHLFNVICKQGLQWRNQPGYCWEVSKADLMTDRTA